MTASASRTRRRIVFPHHNALISQTRSQRPLEGLSNSNPVPSISQVEPATEDNIPDTMSETIMSYLFNRPLLRNPTSTPTSLLQTATVTECLPLLNGPNNLNLLDYTSSDYLPNGVLKLQVWDHILFLEDALSDYPAPFVGVDASRPWLIYWSLLSLHFLGQDMGVYQDRVVKTFVPLQNATGGFGGGEGHLSHLAGTYAALLCLALVGGQSAWGLTKREELWRWLGRLKQADGGFRMTEGGEEDVRGAYCAMVAISLLDLPLQLPADAPARSDGLQTFKDGLGEYLSRCQTYEGGISGAPGNEAHGAYAFCTIACLCLIDRPDRALNHFLDMDALLNWLSSRQYAPEGGFAGRTNKVVDGCYSQWLGGCWPLVLGALNGPKESADEADLGNLYDTEGLARYILNCCQNPHGGLRDKPSKRPDAYHTCYTLAGVSTTQHYHYYEEPEEEDQFGASFAWNVVPNRERQLLASGPTSDATEGLFDAGCKVEAVHPVFVIPHVAVTNMRSWAVKQERLI